MIIALLLLATPAHAGECRKAVAVVAPCAGLLLPSAEAAAGLLCLHTSLPTCKVDAVLAADEAAARLVAMERVAAAERVRGDALDARLAEAAAVAPPKRGWWEHPALWGIVGVVAGVAAGVAISQALR